MVAGRRRVLLLGEQLLQRRLLGSRLLQHQGDVGEVESGFDEPLVEARLRVGMQAVFEDNSPAGVNRRGDAVRLRRESTRQPKKEADNTRRAHHQIAPAAERRRCYIMSCPYRMAYEFSTFM